jgi:hypothetical protein
LAKALSSLISDATQQSLRHHIEGLWGHKAITWVVDACTGVQEIAQLKGLRETPLGLENIEKRLLQSTARHRHLDWGNNTSITTKIDDHQG